MDITYYAFAAYVFLLLCGGIWFFGKVFRSGKKGKDDKTSYEKEQRLFQLYQNVEDMMSGFEEYAEEAKKETESALLETKKMLDEAKTILAELKTTKLASEDTARRAIQKEAAVQREPAAPREAAAPKEPIIKREPAVQREPVAQIEPEDQQEAAVKREAAVQRGVAAQWEAARRQAAQMEEQKGKAYAESPLKTNEKIALLDAQKLSPTDIAKTLGISVREVTMVLEMNRIK